MQKRKPKKQTLCWDCGNYIDGCSWAKQGIPVKGWDADIALQTDANGKGKTISYCVHSCPKFVRDAFKGGSIRLGTAAGDISA